MSKLDEFSYQHLFEGKRGSIKLDAFLRLISEYETALASRDANSTAIDTKASVILSATIALSLASLGFANDYFEKSVITSVVLMIYALAMGSASFFCMKTLWARKQHSLGVIPHIRDVNRGFAEEVMLDDDLELLINKIDKLDCANETMKRITGAKSENIIIAQNIFAFTSAALLASGLFALLLRLY